MTRKDTLENGKQLLREGEKIWLSLCVVLVIWFGSISGIVAT